MFERRKENAAGAADQNRQTSGKSSPGDRGAVIGSSIGVKGEISGDEDLLIEGSVEGTVTLSGHVLTIGGSGQVIADLRAKTVRVEGQVTGDIVAMESAVITRTGRVLGDITAPRVTLEDGGVFKGRIDMHSSDEKLEPAAAPRKILAAGDKAEKKAQSGK